MKTLRFIKLLLFSFVFVCTSCGKKTKHTELDSNGNRVNDSFSMVVIRDSLVINPADTAKSKPISTVYDEDWGEPLKTDSLFLLDDTLDSDGVSIYPKLRSRLLNNRQ